MFTAPNLSGFSLGLVLDLVAVHPLDDHQVGDGVLVAWPEVRGPAPISRTRAASPTRAVAGY